MDFSLNGIQNSVNAAEKKRPALNQTFHHMDKAIADTLDIRRAEGNKATGLGKWLNTLSQNHPGLNKILSPVRNFMLNLHSGNFFSPKERILSGLVGKNTRSTNSTWGARIGNWLAKKGAVGQHMLKALKNPLKGPLFMTAVIDGAISIAEAVKDVAQVTYDKGILAGLWAGTKSLAKSAVGIGSGLLAAGSAALILGTGPIGLAVGTVAYLSGSYLGNKLVGSILPVKKLPSNAYPEASNTDSSAHLTADEILNLPPEKLSQYIDAQKSAYNQFRSR